MRSLSQVPIFKNPGRLEAFSDGVFAIAITLLILEIRVPDVQGAGTPALLWAALLARWPSYFAFVLSFGTILVAWVGHHLLVQQVRHVSWRLVFSNGLFLLSITALPFPTALVAAHLTHPSAPVAAAVYAGVNALNSFTFMLLEQAVRASAPEPAAAFELAPVKARLGVVACLAAALLAFVSPVGALVAIALVWLWWAWPGRNELTRSGP